ncbi:MAG: hypothetical protein HY689_02920 [Chloroflexi bacterium]|nr:hypothetical protein [Chloroflexota bacterium]
MAVIKCPCGNVLGDLVAGRVVIRHRGREVVGLMDAIKCEDCGRVWEPVVEVPGDKQR